MSRYTATEAIRLLSAARDDFAARQNTLDTVWRNMNLAETASGLTADVRNISWQETAAFVGLPFVPFGPVLQAYFVANAASNFREVYNFDRLWSAKIDPIVRGLEQSAAAFHRLGAEIVEVTNADASTAATLNAIVADANRYRERAANLVRAWEATPQGRFVQWGVVSSLYRYFVPQYSQRGVDYVVNVAVDASRAAAAAARAALARIQEVGPDWAKIALFGFGVYIAYKLL